MNDEQQNQQSDSQAHQPEAPAPADQPQNVDQPPAAEAPQNDKLKELEVNGYKFMVDTDALDDVETFEIVDRIENQGQTAAIITLLQLILGRKNYDAMKAHYAQVDAEAHQGQPDYKGRFRLSVMGDVYQAIIREFNPKG